MVSWVSCTRNRLYQKLKRLVMNFLNDKTLKVGKFDSDGAQSTLQCNFSNDSFIPYLFNVQDQESRSSQCGPMVLNNNSLHRFNQTPQNNRAISAFQQVHSKMTQELNPHNNKKGKMSKLDDFSKFNKGSVWAGPLRKWTSQPNESKSSNNFTFKLMSYNVLAQDLLLQHRELYPSNIHNANCLKWDFRWRLLMQEFKYHNADIICLQEVQESHYLQFYSTFFGELGYNGNFKQRTGNVYPDGCAIFYRTKVVEMIEYQSVEYFQPQSTILNRDNIGLIAKFSPRNTKNRSFVVATTHLLFNPKREDVRLAQIQLLLAEIDRLSYEYEQQINVPVILCGDLNSAPIVNNGVYQLITRQQIEYHSIYPPRKGKSWLSSKLGITNDCRHFGLTNKQYKTLSRSEEEQLIQLRHTDRMPNEENSLNSVDNKLFQSGEIVHDFKFMSVYPNIEGVTTNQNKWLTVDYVFYSMTKNDSWSKLRCLGRYELPTEAGLNAKRIKGIPNCKAGSDHFPLIAKFRFEY